MYGIHVFLSIYMASFYPPPEKQTWLSILQAQLKPVLATWP